jgi:hypothetical protein
VTSRVTVSADRCARIDRRPRRRERIDVAGKETSAPFGIRIAKGGVCSKESGIERRRIRINPRPQAPGPRPKERQIWMKKSA